MSESTQSIAERLNRILLADLPDENPIAGSLRIATEGLRAIRQTCKDPSARKLARQHLTILEARATQATEPVEPTIVNGHVLLMPGECRHLHEQFPQCCPVCEGGLQVCRNCPEFEAGLDNPCEATPATTDVAGHRDGVPSPGDGLIDDYDAGPKYHDEVNLSTPTGHVLPDDDRDDDLFSWLGSSRAQPTTAMPPWDADLCRCHPDLPAECTYCLLFEGPASAEKVDAVARIAAGDTFHLSVDEELVSPKYRTAAERDLSRLQHDVAVLSESLHLKQPCACMVGQQQICETCRILDLFASAIGEAAEFLAERPEEAA